VKVSIILPVFNESAFMRVALDSLNDQTIPFELIVVDNGSTDDSAQVARQYTPLVFSVPRGKLYAKQLGVIEASGDVVVFADADVWYPPAFLETLTGHFNDPNVIMAVGVVHYADAEPLQRLANKVRLWFLNFFFKYGGGPVTAYRRSAFLQAGGYNLAVDQFTISQMALEEEVGFHLRMTQLGGRVVYDPRAEAYHVRPREFLCAQCPYAGEDAVCQYCREIAARQRF